MRHRRFVVWIMIIGVVTGTLPAMAAPTASTWGGVKRLYTDEGEFVLGPGVSLVAAAQAMHCATGKGGANLDGPVHVVLAGRSSEGKVLAVMGRGSGGTVDAHLVTESGAYLGGATLDPIAGTICDFVTGAVLVRDEALRSLDPATVGGTILRTLRRVAGAVCSTIITPAVNAALSRLAGGKEMDLKTLAYFALFALILTLCDSLSSINFEQVQTKE